MVNVQDYGGKCYESSETCSHPGCLLKTFLLLELKERTKNFHHWKQKVTPAGRMWWVLVTLAPRTGENASGLWPTPTATAYGSNQGGAAGRTGKIRPSLQNAVK